MDGHKHILDALSLKWIEMGGGRDKLAKKKLPSQAFDVSPNLVVEALPTERMPHDCVSLYRVQQMTANPRFNGAHVPVTFAWFVITPGGTRCVVCRWANWRRNSLSMFREYCDQTDRRYGTLSLDGILHFEAKSVPFSDCQLIHEDELKHRFQSIKTGDIKIVEIAGKMLRKRKSSCEQLGEYRFDQEWDAHDQPLQSRVHKSFIKTMQQLQKRLATEFGNPAQTGSDNHDRIPHNGILQFAIWEIGKKTLYLAVSHEDAHVPCVILVGMTNG